MILSVSATFAADDIAVEDEITDDVLATDVVDDSDDLSEGEASNVVTPDNFGDYFDASGTLTSDADELVFEGDFSGVSVSAITIAKDKPVKFTGKNAIFNNVQFMIMQDNVTIDGFNLSADESFELPQLIYIIGATDVVSNIVLSNNNIKFVAPQGKDGYAIFAGAEEIMGSSVISGLNILNNNITYVGTTDGTTVNNVIRVNGNDFDEDDNFETSKKIVVDGNRFDIQMPSVNVYYDPTTWESKTMAEGIVFYYCDDVKFVNNKVSMKYNNEGQSYDSLYVVSAYNNYMNTFDVASGVEISNNEINATGYNYIYAIRAAVNDINVTDNVITMSANKTQTTGINIEGPIDGGIISNNKIKLNAPWNTYGIYAWGMNGNIENVYYSDNFINLNSYLACGMEINQPDAIIQGNNITALGNFTYGIAASIRPDSDVTVIAMNNIVCAGNNIGFGSGDSILKTGSAGISTLGNAVIRANNVLSSCVGVVSVGETGINSNVTLDDNQITVLATGDVDNYAVKVTGTDKFEMTKNNITFYGITNGNIITNGVYIFDTPAEVSENNFKLIIPAADIVYGPAPAYEETVIAEGIVIDYVDDFKFSNNNITLTYGDILGYYDTIRAIDITNSNNVQVISNKINAKGNQYIYALKLTGNGFVILDNDIVATSNYYANGIDIESPSAGSIVGNNITANAPTSAYPIYAGMNGQDLSLVIEKNNISGEAYYVVGIEVGGNEVTITDNTIDIKGNHTIGIGAFVEKLTVDDNNINSTASNEGNEYIWDNFGTQTAGVVVKKGNFTINDNVIYTTGDYAANLGDCNGTIKDNKMTSNEGVGDDAIIGLGNITSSGNTGVPTDKLKVVIAASGFAKVYGTDDFFKVKLLDEYGHQLFNKTVKVSVGGQTFINVTDEFGDAVFNINVVPEEYVALIKFDGDADYSYKSIYKAFVIEKAPSVITAPDKSLLVTATKSGVNYQIVLKDNSGNVLANQKVTINGKEYTTDDKGVVNYKITASKAGTQKLTVNFAGDAYYAASTKTATIKINKEATKLTAKKKTFKAKVKTKKYTVTLKDSKGKAIKKVKVTLKVKGKKYTAKTNAKGKATFKVKNLKKKGKYTAKVTFAGNNLYNKVAKSVKITVKK